MFITIYPGCIALRNGNFSKADIALALIEI
jgi:hypothetical protein